MVSKSNKDKTGKKKGKNNRIIIISCFILIGAVIFIVFNSSNNKIELINPEYIQIDNTNLIEKKPLLSHVNFTGKRALAYRLAAEIPAIIDKQFCYCYCRKNEGHKTLLTCFTSTHGAGCDTCMDEVIMAYDLYKDGMSVDDITDRIDKEFERYKESQHVH